MTRSAKHVLSLAVLAAVFMAAVGCATTGGAALAPVTCRLLSPAEVATYAPSRPINPFIAHGSFILKSPDEFVVLDLALNLPEQARVSVAASVNDEVGTPVAALWTRTQMHMYWDHMQDITDRDDRIRQDTLDRYYPPASDFNARRGRTEWILVLVGKNPVPRPATVQVSVSLNGAEAQMFSFPLPPVKK